jgi:hypothetical protein
VDVGGNDVRRYQTSVWSTGAVSLCAQLPAGRSVVADVPWFMHGYWEHDARQARDALTQAGGTDGAASPHWLPHSSHMAGSACSRSTRLTGSIQTTTGTASGLTPSGTR